MTTSPRIALVAGVGEGLGGAIARRFARAGYSTVLVARGAERLARIAEDIEQAGGQGVAYVADLREETAVSKLFEDVEKELGPISLAVFNAGANYRNSILDTPADMFEKVWRLSCYAGFLVGREAARHMVPRGQGTIIFTGATASLRGSAQFAAFASAKGALRQLAQSMARELGPKGIHVAQIIVDGAIDTEFIRENFPARYALKERDGIVDPESIAESYWQLHLQPRNAWTHELDLRPWIEPW